jgi:hypothetical protein
MNQFETAENQIKRDFAPHRRVSFRVCKNCGKMYVLSDSSTLHYITKFGSIPLKCEDCRAKNRTADGFGEDTIE